MLESSYVFTEAQEYSARPWTSDTARSAQHPYPQELSEVIGMQSSRRQPHSMPPPALLERVKRKTNKNNTKRVHSLATCEGAHSRALSIADVHDLAYWCQWRLAIHGVCARFDAATQVDADAWSRERLDQVGIARQAALSSEVRHLESQLGRQTSMNAKLEAALSENAQALAKMESARITAAAAAGRLKAQLSRDKETAAASFRELEDRIAHSNAAQQRTDARLREAEAAKLAAEQNDGLARDYSRIETELNEARKEASSVLIESRAERLRVAAMEAEMATVKEKYSALKRRYVDAGRKLETVRAERDSLRNERATLEDKLADVEKFQSSERGRALDRMEQELASEKMARVELEADRDDLQSQLAAALQATART